MHFGCAAASSPGQYRLTGAVSLPGSLATSTFLLHLSRRRQFLVNGFHVNSRHSRPHAAARRAAIDTVAASWIMDGEETGCAPLRSACRMSRLDQRVSAVLARRAAGGPPWLSPP